MKQQERRTWAEISLPNLEHNYRALRALLPEGCRFLGVVKADAYGHGAVPVARKLEELGAEYLAVACLAEARELKALCRRFGVPFLINDNVEIAAAVDADGVHVGQSDIKGRDIRAMIGPDKILGISAGTVEEAQAAEKAGADYIGVGAVFGTSTKKNARNLSKEKLKEISSSVSIPVVAIGGINASNVAELSGCGVDGVAVVSAIFAAEDPGAATEHLKTLAAEMVSHE